MRTTLRQLNIPTQSALGKYITRYYSGAVINSIIEGKHLVYSYNVMELLQIAYQRYDYYKYKTGNFNTRAVINALAVVTILIKYRNTKLKT